MIIASFIFLTYTLCTWPIQAHTNCVHDQFNCSLIKQVTFTSWEFAKGHICSLYILQFYFDWKSLPQSFYSIFYRTLEKLENPVHIGHFYFSDHSIHSGINPPFPPSKIPQPSFLPNSGQLPPLKSTNCPSPPFYVIPTMYWFFVNPPNLN